MLGESLEDQQRRLKSTGHQDTQQVNEVPKTMNGSMASLSLFRAENFGGVVNNVWGVLKAWVVFSSFLCLNKKAVVKRFLLAIKRGHCASAHLSVQ